MPKAAETNYNQVVMKFDNDEYDSDKLFGYDSAEEDDESLSDANRF